MKNICILLFLTICFVTAKARSPKGNGKITGKVIDSVTKQPVEYASVSIFKAGETSPFNGTVSDAKGNFTIDNIANGEYSIRIDFMGYKPHTIGKVILGSGASAMSLNTILLMPSQTQLQAVNIVGKAPMVENKIDKMVYNAANDLTSQSGVALDVLKKVPMVNVDIDGNVELQGGASVKFLINGKPSSIFGSSLTDALQSIPASQIKSIEVITSPGAKYDASGTGGIINIILKDSKVQGINGSVNLSVGTRIQNGSFNLNARRGNFGVNAFFSGNKQLNSTTINNIDRMSYSGTRDTITHLSQKGNNDFVRDGYQSGINFNWTISPNDELTAGVGFDHFGNKNSGLTMQDQQVMRASGVILSDTLSNRNSNSQMTENAIDWNLSYKKTFNKKGQELDVLVTSSFGKNNNNFFQQQDYLTGSQDPTGTRANNPGKSRETDIAIDYTHPISDNFIIETGAKTIFENLSSNTVTETLQPGGAFAPNADQTYSFNYSRKIFSYYLSTSFGLFNFINGKAGLRDEYTKTTADFPGAVIPSYNILSPSFTLSHDLDKTQSIKFSYSYRIERPDYGEVNPFYNVSDPHNISTGNPNLKPEVGHNYELGYNRSFDSGANIYVGANYRYNTDDIQSFTTFDTVLYIRGTKYTNVFLSQRYNIGRQTSKGVNIFGSFPIDKLNLRTNIQAGWRTNETPGLPSVTGFAARINLNASYQLNHDLTAEAFGNYNSSQKNIQGLRPAFYIYTFAVRKLLLKKQASIGLTASNPFSLYVNQRSTTTGANFDQVNMRQVPFRTFGVTLSYKFGKLEFKKDKDKDDNGGGIQAPPEN